MSPDIFLENLTFSYKQQCIFENITLHLPGSSCTALLGSSGVGKSTLLHVMTNAPLDPGAVFSGSIHTSDRLPLLERIMLMTQQDGLFPWLNVLDNVLIGYRLRQNLSVKIRQRAMQLLKSIGLTADDYTKKPKQLSGGMRQRVALIRLVLENKPVWLLDEAFAATDALTRYKLQNLMTELWADKTVLLVTHDPLEALRLADFIYVMHGAPAKLSTITLPPTQTPRTMTAELMGYQNQIFSLLETRS